MCTIVALRNVHRAFPLVIAANRDEFYRRPALAPSLRSTSPRILAGQDRDRGGTWMGVGHDNFFVGVTNQRTWKPADAGLRSRGEVVMACLADGSLDAVTDRLAKLDARAYNPFNLMFGDVKALRVAYVRHEAPFVRFEDLGDGVTALANDQLGSSHFPKTDRVEGRLRDARLSTLSWEDLAPHLEAALGDHELPAKHRLEDPPAGALFPKFLAHRLQALCVHTPAYGTVSSTLIAFSPTGLAHYHYADGHPCETGFARVVG